MMSVRGMATPDRRTVLPLSLSDPAIKTKLPCGDRLEQSGLPRVIRSGKHDRIREIKGLFAETLEILDRDATDHWIASMHETLFVTVGFRITQ